MVVIIEIIVVFIGTVTVVFIRVVLIINPFWHQVPSYVPTPGTAGAFALGRHLMMSGTFLGVTVGWGVAMGITV